MNVFTFSGNLGRDCRTNTVGQSFVANFSVAVTEGFGANKKTHWVECAYWGKGAEAVAPYLLKGQQVIVSGELGMKEATGEYKAAPTCRVAQLSLAGGKREGHEPAPRQSDAQQSHEPASNFDDEIPF